MPEPDLLSSLQPPTLQSVMAPMDTLGQVGVGLAGMGRSQNPFLVQAQEQFRQQVELRRLQREVQQDRQRRNEALLTIYGDLSKSENPEVRKKIIPEYAKMFEATFGTPPPPALTTELIDRRMGPDALKSLYRDIVSKSYSDETLISRYHVPPQEFSEHKKAAGTNAARKFAGLDPVEADEMAAMRLERERSDTFFKKHLNLIPNSDQVVYADQYARKKFGRPLFELDESQLNEAAQFGTARVKQDTLDKEERAFRQKFVLAQAQAAQKALDPIKVQKELASITSAQTVDAEVTQMLDAYRKLSTKKLVPQGPGLGAALLAKGKQTLKPGDIDLYRFSQLWLPRMVGLVDRGAFDEKGVRSIQVFQKQMSTLALPPPLAAVEELVEELKASSRRKATEQLKNLEASNAPTEVLKRAREILRSMESSANIPPVPKGFTPVKP